jgi:2-amino-4-hydroxy-6-hydroxymethyldihydropteridine diphosphokinase
VTLAYVGLGANLDDPRRQVERALDELDAMPHSRLVEKSSLYRSAPIGHASQPEFVNAVAGIQTSLPAQQLLAELQQVEAAHGRRRSFANAPRTLDLDLLLFADSVIAETTLTVPHPRMHERAFVLKPLIEIAPDIDIPGRGPARALLARCAGQSVEKIA